MTPQPETQRANVAANDYVPTNAQLAAFHAQQRVARRFGDYNPLTVYVNGRPGIAHPSTDELIQWASHKWGIPTDWIRAEMTVESGWQQDYRGDLGSVGASYGRYPLFARVASTRQVYESLGIAQEKWIPDSSIGAGTEPLRWESTAFSLDYYAATVRYFYDGDCNWCSPGYHAGEAWRSIGGWFEPEPWGNADSVAYIANVKAALAAHIWTRPGF